MKKRTITSMFFVLFFVFSCYGNIGAETIEETLKKTFPGITFDSVRPTDIKGLYEIVSGHEIIYFVADPGYLIVGDIIGKGGWSVTELRKSELVAESTKNLPLDKAIKTGSGKNTIIEFTDPDCGYCRNASSILGQRQDVTRYIFFFPLPSHHDAENKIKYIFCAADRVNAYEEAMKGKLDDQKYEICSKPEASELLKIHKEVGQNLGVKGTPFFIVNRKKMVLGAEIPEIEAALEK
jgi:thiol:disulfide interchange protein DsbC